MRATYMPNLLTIGCWNIQEIYEKVNDIKICEIDEDVFINTVEKFDILCIQETHTASDNLFAEIKGFQAIPHCRKVSSNNRYFGGFMVLVRNTIRKGVNILDTDDKDIFEIKLQKDFFGLQYDIKILFTYASPINSPYIASRTENVLEKWKKC